MTFIPKSDNKKVEIPYYDDVTSSGGWQGHATGKSIDTLKSEVFTVLGRLGAVVNRCQQGDFEIDGKARQGYRIFYAVESADGNVSLGRIDIAALPVKTDHKLRKSYESRKTKALKMVLYMLRQGLDGIWFLQRLSPGFSPLLPWMLVHDKTISQLWIERENQDFLLDPGDDFVEGEYTETK